MSVVQLEPARDGWDDRTVAQLLTLASSRSAEDRQRLLLKVTGLCEAAPPPPSVAPLLADAIRRIHSDDSVSELFDRVW